MKKLLLLLICVLFAAPTFALTGVSFGIKGGLVTNYDQPGFAIPGEETDNMTLAGLQMRVNTLPMLDVILTGEYAWKNDSYQIMGQGFDLNRHDWLFTASAVYPIPFQIVSPYLGAGLGTHSLGYDVTMPSSWTLEDYDIWIPVSETRFGYHLMTGVVFKVPTFPLNFNAEFRLNWVDTPGDVTKYNSFTAGLSFALP
jgi:opacity protein-like surface antigen